MLKKSLYPKTRRINDNVKGVEITEKLDGSNLGIFKKEEKLWIAQRNYVFCWDDIKNDGSNGLYKGLFGWLAENADEIKERLHDGSGVFGEWLGMGKIKYGQTDIDKKYYIFAKARLNEGSIGELEVSNIIYTRDLVPWAFAERNLPECIKQVPVVETPTSYPTVEYLNGLYEKYCENHNRKVEGFVVNNNEQIKKYVRYKNGKLTEHKS